MNQCNYSVCIQRIQCEFRVQSVYVSLLYYTVFIANIICLGVKMAQLHLAQHDAAWRSLGTFGHSARNEANRCTRQENDQVPAGGRMKKHNTTLGHEAVIKQWDAWQSALTCSGMLWPCHVQWTNHGQSLGLTKPQNIISHHGARAQSCKALWATQAAHKRIINVA